MYKRPMALCTCCDCGLQSKIAPAIIAAGLLVLADRMKQNAPRCANVQTHEDIATPVDMTYIEIRTPLGLHYIQYVMSCLELKLTLCDGLPPVSTWNA
jgi:hypothetical protein